MGHSIKSVNLKKGTITLDYPNKEVERSFSIHLLADLSDGKTDKTSSMLVDILEALENNSIENFIELINILFKGISYTIVDTKEKYFHSIFYIIVKLLGFTIESEILTIDGRIDAVVFTDDYIYIIEFKAGYDSKKAIEQIKAKEYYKKYSDDKRKKILLGINFNMETKCVDDFKVEEIWTNDNLMTIEWPPNDHQITINDKILSYLKFYLYFKKKIITSSMKNLPIGIQEFTKLITKNYLYIDKTKYIYQLITTGSYYFLSRPRRFGKSLLLNTIKEIFKNNKELFKGLWIYDKIEWKEYPVIKISFADIDFSNLGLKNAIDNMLINIAQEYNLELTKSTFALKFKELIQKLSEKEQVVILIDEYDKPIIDYIDELEKAEENRKILKSFYSIIKDSDNYIKLFFITGVSKFSQVSIFSDLNNLNDITLDKNYAVLTGYTQDELEIMAIDYPGMDQLKLLGTNDTDQASGINPEGIIKFYATQENYGSGIKSYILRQNNSNIKNNKMSARLANDISSGTDTSISQRMVGAISKSSRPETGFSRKGTLFRGSYSINIPYSAWFASSGPVSFSNVWILPIPTLPTDLQSRLPRYTIRSGGIPLTTG